MAMPAVQQAQQAMHFSVLSWLSSQAASHSQDRMFVYTLPRMVLQSILGYLSLILSSLWSPDLSVDNLSNGELVNA